MFEEMKLFFLWPRLRYDISRCVRDQGPISFTQAIQIAQRIESATKSESNHIKTQIFSTSMPNVDNVPTPMDIDIQNTQSSARCTLPSKDSQGRPKCFSCNNYGHIKNYCRKVKSYQQQQNSKFILADAASLAELPGNESLRRWGKSTSSDTSLSFFQTPYLFHVSTNRQTTSMKFYQIRVTVSLPLVKLQSTN